ncbi:probable cytochrome P450 318a1 [Eupeodes corollae]|uniref:probable cytochrome P450 318a1 n=1 Tax=Eupeodes corollae TaxID=290404 RepID=UPI0024913012|nr:probable cytochrome P450 318a1 [Eupeodes corollae]
MTAVENNLLLVISVLFSIYVWINRAKFKLIWQINGARGIFQQPLLFILMCFMLDPKRLLETLRYLRKYFKRPLAFLFGSQSVLYVDDPVMMERVLNSPECLDKTFLQDGFFVRKGLLHAKGQQWKIRRKQLNPTFSYGVLMSFFPTFNSVANSLHSKFSDYLGLQEFNEIEDIISRAVLVTACQTTMGTETNFLENDEHEIAQTYKKLLRISSIKTIKPWLQIDFLFRMTKLYNTDIELNKMAADFVKDIVSRKHNEWKKMNVLNTSSRSTSRIKIPSTTEVEGTSWEEVEVEVEDTQRKKRNFIEQIFHLAENGEITLQDIMDECNSMVLVAFETVSNSILLALLCLAMYPETQKKLRQELHSTFPNGDVSSISGDNLKDMKFLDMVINESLRLVTTIPMALRGVSKDFVLKDDIVIPKGTFIILDTFNMQRDSALWGPFAQEFYPEHFLPENVAKRHPYTYVPFMKGLRFCIGWRYSLMLTKVIIAKLIHSYSFETETKLKDLKFIEGISLKIRDCDKIKFTVSRVRN